MFAPERIKLIKRILLDKKHVDVSSLSSMLDVSEVTIRRDLEKLERERFLTRTHGGAILNEEDFEDESSLEVDDDPFTDYRNEISEIAAHLIEDNDVIILSPGLTNLYISKKILNKKNLTVLTNDLNIASELSTNTAIKIIVPGGDLDSTSMTLVGSITEENIKQFYVNKAFIEVDGVSMMRGYTVQNMSKALTIKEMLKVTSQPIIVCLYKAFDQNGFAQIAPVDLKCNVLTNNKLPDHFKKFYFENNIQLYTAY